MKPLAIVLFLLLILVSCKKNKTENKLQYYQVGMKHSPADWRDSAFVVATSNPALVLEITKQLTLPVAERKMVAGELVRGSGGYNKNGTHEFLWRLAEDGWGLIQFSIEIYDGSPYSGVDSDTAYWFNQMKRFSPWSSYISKEIIP